MMMMLGWKGLFYKIFEWKFWWLNIRFYGSLIFFFLLLFRKRFWIFKIFLEKGSLSNKWNLDKNFFFRIWIYYVNHQTIIINLFWMFFTSSHHNNVWKFYFIKEIFPGIFFYYYLINIHHCCCCCCLWKDCKTCCL